MQPAKNGMLSTKSAKIAAEAEGFYVKIANRVLISTPINVRHLFILHRPLGHAK
jgi:hypothetical protein